MSVTTSTKREPQTHAVSPIEPEGGADATQPPRRRNLPAWALPLALFAGTLAVYIRTLRPSFNWLDNSELITAAYHLGIGHNPGYPTFMLIGHLFSWLPIGSVAYRLNLMAAVLGALAVVLLYLVCLRVTRNRIASAFAALTAAFSYTFWDLTTEAEVYTLHACLMLGAILLLVRWREQGRDRDLYLAWLVMGVSLGNHALTALMIPALAALVVMHRGWRHLWPKRMWGCAGALVAGAAVYLYIPLRAMANPPPEVNNPHTLKAFGQLLSSPGCRKLMFSMGAGKAALRAMGFGLRTVRELGPFGIGAALLGIALALRADAKLTAALLLLVGLNVFYAVNYDIFDIYTYFLPAYLVLAIFMAVGLKRVLAWGERALAWLQRGTEDALTQPRRIALVAVLLTYLPVWAFSANFALVDASRDHEAEDFARNAFEIVQPGAVIVGDWWSIAPLGYLKYVEGLRPDVSLSVALSSFDFGEVVRVLNRDFLTRYPAAYVAEHQTPWRRTFRRRHPYEYTGDLLRVYADGKPQLRARVEAGSPVYRFGDDLGLMVTECEPREVPQGRILRITHRWKQLARRDSGGLARPSSDGQDVADEKMETLTSIIGPDGCIWRVRSDLANGFYTPETWRPGEVAEERHVAFIASDAPPGDYTITVRARCRRTSHCLRVCAPGSEEPVLEAVAATVRVIPRQPRLSPLAFAPRHW